MQTLDKLRVPLALRKVQSNGMKYIPKILEQLKDFPEPIQLAVVHLLYFGLLMSAVAPVAWVIVALLTHHR